VVELFNLCHREHNSTAEPGVTWSRLVAQRMTRSGGTH
jgi:hypothetical protein